ncbi:MAG: hypothetical protein ACYDET_06510 [Thermoleophilia bacterium]
MLPDKSSREYLEQWDRVKRWYKRCAEDDGSNFEAQKDNFYALFQSCFHLQDWIKNSTWASDKPEIQDMAYEFAKGKSSIELGICKNICNGSKHLGKGQIGRKNRHLDDLKKDGIPVNLPFAREFDHYARAAGDASEVKVIVFAGGRKYDCLKLASKCLTLWEQFMVENALL